MREPNYEAARRALAQARAESGMGYLRLSKAAGVSKSSVISLEMGHSAGALSTWFAVAEALDVNVGDLLEHLHDDPGPDPE